MVAGWQSADTAPLASAESMSARTGVLKICSAGTLLRTAWRTAVLPDLKDTVTNAGVGKHLAPPAPEQLSTSLRRGRLPRPTRSGRQDTQTTSDGPSLGRPPSSSSRYNPTA